MPIGLNRELKNDAGAKFSAAALAATDNSESLSIQGLDVVGLGLDISAATGTLDIKAEISFDGSAWMEFPEDVNSETQAAFTQITAAGDVTKYWTIPFAAMKDQDVVGSAATYPVVRFVFTIGGGGSVTFTRIQIIARSFAI